MRRSPWMLALLAGAAAGGCADVTPLTQPRAAAAPLAARGDGDGPRYRVEVLTSTLGSAPNRGNAINDRGWVAGFSGRPDTTRHAALWRGGPVVDLGTLGGRNSTVAWPGLNNRGVVVGISQTGTPDPLDEAWSCGDFLGATPNTCLGFVWQDGVLTALPTLGGNNGYAAGVNARGHVVGWAETRVLDPTCSRADSQYLQFRAVRWEPGRRWRPPRAVQLRPYPGDSASAAVAINDRGLVVGISGECDRAVGRRTARRAVRWLRDDRPDTLPTLGGTTWHTPTALNARGDAVGFSNPRDPRDAAGEFVARAVLWPRTGGIVEIGRLPGDSTSQAQGINDRGQVVGLSVGAGGVRAFLWEDGVLHDLNRLAPGAPGVLVTARAINGAGEITGDIRVDGRTLPFVAVPVRGRR